MTDDSKRLGDQPIQPEYAAMMNRIMGALDGAFNGELKGKDKTTGIVLLTFPMNEIEPDGKGRCNFISNGANRKDLVVLFKEMIAQFEGQPDITGHA